MMSAIDRVCAAWDCCSLRVRIHLFGCCGPHMTTVGVPPIELVPLPVGESTPPTFEIESAAAQQLMDQLWQCGFRPTEGTGSAGSLAATQKHLEDMRAIAFAGLKATKP